MSLIVAVPYPGRGHINPMMNLCTLIASRRPHEVTVLVILTQEWLGLLGGSDSDGLRVVTIPNVLPSELVRGSDHAGFLEAVLRDMEDPVEKVVDGLGRKPDLIISDTFLPWAIRIGRAKGVPVASFWPASASVFSVFYHHDLVVGSKYYPIHLSELTCEILCIHEEEEEEIINFIPGIPSIRLEDLPDVFQVDRKRILDVIIQAMSNVKQAKCILFRSIKDLEQSAIKAIKTSISIPIYPIGPSIPYFNNSKPTPSVNAAQTQPNYIKWLNCQPNKSVLYISLGSYLLTTNNEIEELASGLKQSGVRFLWVARDQADKLTSILGDQGMVISWCDQMSVLKHTSVGGFLTHCGWNSTLETTFAGVPALAFPLGADQPLDCKMIVEDWNVGWRLKRNCRESVRRDEVSVMLKSFMDLEGCERKELDEKSKRLRERLVELVAHDGSTTSLDVFLKQCF